MQHVPPQALGLGAAPSQDALQAYLLMQMAYLQQQQQQQQQQQPPQQQAHQASQAIVQQQPQQQTQHGNQAIVQQQPQQQTQHGNQATLQQLRKQYQTGADSAVDFMQNYMRNYTDSLAQYSESLQALASEPYQSMGPEELAVIGGAVASSTSAYQIYKTSLDNVGAGEPAQLQNFAGALASAFIGAVIGMGANMLIRQQVLVQDYMDGPDARAKSLNEEVTNLTKTHLPAIVSEMKFTMVDPMDQAAVSLRTMYIQQTGIYQRLVDSQGKITRKGNDPNTLYVGGQQLTTSDLRSLHRAARIYAGCTYWGTPEAHVMVYNEQLSPLRSARLGAIGYSETGQLEHVQAIMKLCGCTPSDPLSWDRMSRGYQRYIALHTALWAPRGTQWYLDVNVGTVQTSRAFASVFDDVRRHGERVLNDRNSPVCMMEPQESVLSSGHITEEDAYREVARPDGRLASLDRDPAMWYELPDHYRAFLEYRWGFLEPVELKPHHHQAIIERMGTRLTHEEAQLITYSMSGKVPSDLYHKLRQYNVTMVLDTPVTTAGDGFARMRLQALHGSRVVAYATCLEDVRNSGQVKNDRVPLAQTQTSVATVRDGVGNAAAGNVIWVPGVNQTAIVTDRLPDGTVRVLMVPYYYELVTGQERQLIPGAPKVTLDLPGRTSVDIVVRAKPQADMNDDETACHQLGLALVNHATLRPKVANMLYALNKGKSVPVVHGDTPDVAGVSLDEAWRTVATDVRSSQPTQEDLKEYWPRTNDLVQSLDRRSRFFEKVGTVRHQRIEGQLYGSVIPIPGDGAAISEADITDKVQVLTYSEHLNRDHVTVPARDAGAMLSVQSHVAGTSEPIVQHDTVSVYDVCSQTVTRHSHSLSQLPELSPDCERVMLRLLGDTKHPHTLGAGLTANDDAVETVSSVFTHVTKDTIKATLTDSTAPENLTPVATGPSITHLYKLLKERFNKSTTGYKKLAVLYDVHPWLLNALRNVRP